MTGSSTAGAEARPAGNGKDCFDIAAGSVEPHLSGGTAAWGRSLDVGSILSALGETAYTWDIAADRLDWDRNALEVLGVPSLKSISSGAAYRFLIDPEHAERRRLPVDGESADAAEGTPYRLHYRLKPSGRCGDVSVWVEDYGRWWPGSDGTPARAVGLVRLMDERYRKRSSLLHRGDHDELTGQLNRLRLIEAIDAALEQCRQARLASTLLMVAINELTFINETFGFETGDEVLAAVGRTVGSALRRRDVIGRYSSNKFGVILKGCGAAAARAAAERIISAVRGARIEAGACPLSVTVTIGAACLSEHAAGASQAIGQSLQALSRAKQSPAEGLCIYEPSIRHDNVRRMSTRVANDVIAALDSGRMHLALQPVVSTSTGRPAFYECLLRMRGGDGTLTSAGDFITVAEQLGLARHVDRRALELAVGVLRQHPRLNLSLNVSGLTCGDHDWLAALNRLTARDGLARRLTIEITETAAIQDLDQSVAFVDTLKELGCRVAIDDFGAGYTSFKNLKHLGVDIVKIDGTFVKNVCRDRSDQVFVRAMVDLARNLGLQTVAEWVGDGSTALMLAQAGVDYLQGYHVGRPIMAADLAPAAVDRTA